jgi:hypothetical protein
VFEATERAPEFQVAVNMRLDSTVKSWDSAHYEKLGENKASAELLQKYPTKKNQQMHPQPHQQNRKL